jgi:hypothetical protein
MCGLSWISRVSRGRRCGLTLRPDVDVAASEAHDRQGYLAACQDSLLTVNLSRVYSSIVSKDITDSEGEREQREKGLFSSGSRSNAILLLYPERYHAITFITIRLQRDKITTKLLERPSSTTTVHGPESHRNDIGTVFPLDIIAFVVHTSG